jgi:N-acetylglutamate synthase-like GNAT family acetyltransferase
MIRSYRQEDFADVLAVINDGAEAYRNVIPSDQWHEPYMSADALSKEIADGVAFRVFEVEGKVTGVMGAQPVQDVLLIRHAYVESNSQRQGVGGALIADLLSRAMAPVLVGTWAAAAWAIEFYRKHGFELVSEEEKNLLLRTYWSISDRQIETSVVLRLIS